MMDESTNLKNEAVKTKSHRSSSSFLSFLLYLTFYITGILTFLLIIADPFTMTTYFSDNSLLPGLVNREFSLSTEAEYYLKDLNKQVGFKTGKPSLATSPGLVKFIKHELDSFGIEVYEQNFNFQNGSKFNGTNIYSYIRGERSTSSESVVLCAPVKFIDEHSNTLSSVALSLALAKYFSTKSYWAKDVIVLFVDHDHYGATAWIDSYYDVRFKADLKRSDSIRDGELYYESLVDRSGPMQAAILLELYGKEFSRINVKIQGLYGQLPNLDLFNLVIELAIRESVTPYFHNKSMPFDLSTEELYRHHLETAMSFMITQATMKSDGLHGLFLRYAVQSLTLEGPEHTKNLANKDFHLITSSLLNVGRLVEGIFRSLNNLTERFNRSYYFYMILSLRRFTSIGYYMIPFALMIVPVLIKALRMYKEDQHENNFISKRCFVLLTFALVLSLLSTINISTALISSVALVPILIVL